jgi:hypothetical protein
MDELAGRCALELPSGQLRQEAVDSGGEPLPLVALERDAVLR